MQKAKVVDNSLPNGDFQDSSSQAALDGTILRATFQNDNFGNLFELVQKAGQTLIDDDTSQVSKAVVKQSLSGFYIDSGTANSVELSNTGIDEEVLFDGMVVMFTPANANTGATTLKVKTLDAKPLYFDGAVLTAGFLETDSNYIAIYDVASGRFNCDLLVNSKNLASAISGIDLSVKADKTEVIGINQTWQDVTSSRALATTYTNSTGKPIQLSIATGDGADLNLLINGVQIIRTRASTGNNNVINNIVPNGDTYRLESIALSFTSWFELR